MLNEVIGANAGKVWTVLQEGTMGVKAIKKATKLNEKDLNLALGWLAREGKVSFAEEEGELTLSLV